MIVFSFLRFYLNFQVVEKYQQKFGNYGNDLYANFVFVQYLRKLYIVRKWKALGLEEKSLTSCPTLVRFLVTISSIWCHLWKSTQARPIPFSAQFSALESTVDTPTAWAGEHVLAPPFFILNSETFPCRHIVCSQATFLIEMVIYYFFGKRCGIITKWMNP